MNRDASGRTSALYPVPSGIERPLRVVLVVPPQVPAWLRVFRDLALRHEWLELVLVSGPEAPLPRVLDTGVGVRLFLAWERLVHRGANTRLTPEALASPPGPGVRATTPDALLAQVEALSPDLALVVGPQEWASVLAPCVAMGCWHLDASLVDARYAGLSLLSFMLRGEPATHVELVVQGATLEPVLVAGSWGRTRASFLKTRNDAFCKLPALLLRALLRVAAGQGPPLGGSAAELRLRPQSLQGHAAGVRLLLSTLRAQARSLRGRFKDRGWMLVVRDGPAPLDPAAPEMGRHTLLKASEGWWADPCVVSTGQQVLLFVEEMDLATGKASIACVELARGGARRLGTALRERGHLSFPQVFRWEDEWYMTVESGYARRSSLYRARGFPLEWRRVRDLVAGWACVDPVLHRHEGHWYLFVNVAESGNSTSDDLFLFVADAPEGPFRPHPASPIVCDVRRARMAGRIFSHQGRLIRPSQDCGPNYGNAVVFNEILELGPGVYRERVLSKLAADFARTPEGCHSYSIDGGVEALDIFGRAPRDAVFLELFDGDRPRAPAGAVPSRTDLAPPRGADVAGMSLVGTGPSGRAE